MASLNLHISDKAEAFASKEAAKQGLADAAAFAARLLEETAEKNGSDLSNAGEEIRLTALKRFVDRIRQKSTHFPQGYAVDDSRDSIYEGRGE